MPQEVTLRRSARLRLKDRHASNFSRFPRFSPNFALDHQGSPHLERLEAVQPSRRELLLCNEVMRLLLADELFTFVTQDDVVSPNGETLPAPGTNNESERSLRGPAQCRDTGRTNKTANGARRQTILVTTLESLRLYLSEFTLAAVLQEISHWWDAKATCFQKLLKSLKISSDDQASGILNQLFPAPDSS